ncbi:hypothetical protein [Stutzerimonas balearica]|uniref:hypothetical protein n=2 Tax=Stutzerimonas balearica TaxID=74829 RepID=UPI00289B1880|nr:hypothetical protein [Stutzerimonas balearica]
MSRRDGPRRASRPPTVQLTPRAARVPMPRTDAAGTLDQRGQLFTSLRYLLFRQRHARPGADTAGEQFLDSRKQCHLPRRAPPGQRRQPLLLEQRNQRLHLLGPEQLEKHTLAPPMSFIIEALHATLAEQRLLQHPRSRAGTFEATFVIEQPSRFFAADAQRVLQQQAHLEHVTVQSPAAFLDEGVAVAEQRQRTFDSFLAWNFAHGSVPGSFLMLTMPIRGRARAATGCRLH